MTTIRLSRQAWSLPYKNCHRQGRFCEYDWIASSGGKFAEQTGNDSLKDNRRRFKIAAFSLNNPQQTLVLDVAIRAPDGDEQIQ